MSKIVEFPEDRDGRDHDSVKEAVMRVIDAYGQPEVNTPFRTYADGDLRLSLDKESGTTDVTFKGHTVFSNSYSSGLCDPGEGTDREGWIDKLRMIVENISTEINE